MADSFVRPVQVYVTTSGRSKKVATIEGDRDALRAARIAATRAAQRDATERAAHNPRSSTASGTCGGFGISRGRFACRH